MAALRESFIYHSERLMLLKIKQKLIVRVAELQCQLNSQLYQLSHVKGN